METATTIEIDAREHFHPFGKRWLTPTPVLVRILPQMYAPARKAKHHWLHLTFTGFQVLAQRLEETGLTCRTFATIGTSSGLDAIGALQAFHPDDVVVTDVLPSVVPVAVENIQRNCGRKPVRIRGLCGSLLEPVERAGVSADLIYENLPNLPTAEGESTLYNAGASAASFYPRHDSEESKSDDASLLELHYSFLRRAKHSLRPKGSVVCAIGGRVGWQRISRMFREHGYVPEVLSYMLKPQEQAAECLPAYAAAESGSSFAFYPFEQAQTLLDHNPQLAPGRSIVAEATIEYIERALAPVRISAAAAVKLFQQHQDEGSDNETVGHLAYLVRGIPTAK